MRAREFDLFAVTAHGLSDLCARELAAIGVVGSAEPGGVAWRGTARTMHRANLELRTASRVIARVGTFRARGFPELERHAARLPWRDFLHESGRVALRVTCRRSRLYHEGAVAERIARVLHDRLGVDAVPGVADEDGDAAHADARLVIVRFHRDVCTISVDSSGELLHRRGYRQAIAKAPLRETLAAALVLASGWRGDSTLIDPLCGSGTIPIEAALLARRIAPGLANPDLEPRGFAFETWPGFEPETWREVVAAARGSVRDARCRILASDRDGAALAAARSNAARAGVEHDIEFMRAPLAALAPAEPVDAVVTNPPYGVRVGARRDLAALHAELGRAVRERLMARSVTLISADDALSRATGLPFREVLTTRNGGIAVRLLTARIDDPAHIGHRSGVAVRNANEERT